MAATDAGPWPGRSRWQLPQAGLTLQRAAAAARQCRRGWLPCVDRGAQLPLGPSRLAGVGAAAAAAVDRAADRGTRSASWPLAFPKTIPGTYATEDYGKYIKGLEAYKSDGTRIKVRKKRENTFKLSAQPDRPRRFARACLVLMIARVWPMIARVWPMIARGWPMIRAARAVPAASRRHNPSIPTEHQALTRAPRFTARPFGWPLLSDRLAPRMWQSG